MSYRKTYQHIKENLSLLVEFNKIFQERHERGQIYNILNVRDGEYKIIFYL